jgi:hypothetical protein
MFHAGDLFLILAFVGPRNLVPDKLFAGPRMLAFGESRKMLLVDWVIEIPLSSESALPFAMASLVMAPIVLLLRRKLFHVVGACLTG